MTKSTRRSRRTASAALLLLVLAITTGWTQTAAPTVQDARLTASALPASAQEAATPRLAMAAERVNVLALQTSSSFMANRASEAALAIGARALYQAHVIATREAPPVVVRVKAPVVTTTPKTYSGKNHFWFPALGISRPVYLFECTRSREPDNYVYRWGCAGKNNVYLLGHAATVFRSLHDAYNAGRLKIGMVAIYADGNGRIRTYRITSWRVVDPVDSHWAIADQPVPSMTLQTCVGPNGVDRLNVRLVAFD